eukprot:scaffold211_cov447-Prasinococcus_capsulatus_cf.AAC.12
MPQRLRAPALPGHAPARGRDGTRGRGGHPGEGGRALVRRGPAHVRVRLVRRARVGVEAAARGLIRRSGWPAQARGMSGVGHAAH